MMRFEEFMNKVEHSFPGATVGKFVTGELVIYTGLYANGDGTVGHHVPAETELNSHQNVFGKDQDDGSDHGRPSPRGSGTTRPR